MRNQMVRWDGDDLYWSELRPNEGGRIVVCRRDADGSLSDVTPEGFNARSRVHEYGGGHYLLDVLKENRIEHIDVCGIATDYCVKASALDARKNQFQVRVLVNLCAAVNEATGQLAIEEMRAAGCQLQAATAP